MNTGLLPDTGNFPFRSINAPVFTAWYCLGSGVGKLYFQSVYQNIPAILLNMAVSNRMAIIVFIWYQGVQRFRAYSSSNIVFFTYNTYVDTEYIGFINNTHASLPNHPHSFMFVLPRRQIL